MGALANPKKQKFIKIDEDVAEVLRSQLAYDGVKVQITGRRLDPSLYKRVNKVLEQFGGVWTRGAQAHVFPSAPRELIDGALSAGKVLNQQQSYQFFETPAQIADQMVVLAEVDSDVKDWLEPSCGNGALIAAIFRVDSLVGFSLDAVDIDPSRCAHVRRHFLCRAVHERDFLTFSGGPYCRILMNPPFTGGQDAEHIMHAFELLRDGGRLVAIVGDGSCTRQDRRSVSFRQFLEKCCVAQVNLEPGAFKESGTMTGSRIVVLAK